jgi:hypothetical protein
MRLLRRRVGAGRAAPAVQRHELRYDEGRSELHGARAPRHRLPLLAVATTGVRPPGLLPGGVPPLAPQQAPGVRRRLAGAEPSGVADVPPRVRVPAGARVPRRGGEQVPAVGVPGAQRHGVRLLVAVPRQGNGEG